MSASVPLHAIYRFKPKAAQALSLIGVLLLLIPKVNLISLQDRAAGLRLDDALLFSCLGLFITVYCIYLSRGFRAIESVFAIWLAFLLLSNAVNLIVYDRSSILYSIRFIEYFLFFYFGYHFARRYSLIKFAYWVISINGIAMVLQTLGVIGGFASGGYFEGTTGVRAVGLTGGPWEVGVVINFCFAILIFSRPVRTRYALMMFVVTTSLLLLAASRMAMLANVIVFVAFYRHKGYPVMSLVWKSSLALAVLAASVIFIPNPLTERSQSLLSSDNLGYLAVAYDAVPENPRVEGFTAGWDGAKIGESSEGDASWLMRVIKWCAAIKLWTRNPVSFLLGIGNGTVGPALDGGWLRIITETGIIGLIIFVWLARTIWRISLTLKVMLIATAINMLMIDIYIAYKAMALLLFTAGAMSFNEGITSRRAITSAAEKGLLVRQKAAPFA